jgi:hypothetical protein
MSPEENEVISDLRSEAAQYERAARRLEERAAELRLKAMRCLKGAEYVMKQHGT